MVPEPVEGYKKKLYPPPPSSQAKRRREEVFAICPSASSGTRMVVRFLYALRQAQGPGWQFAFYMPFGKLRDQDGSSLSICPLASSGTNLISPSKHTFSRFRDPNNAFIWFISDPCLPPDSDRKNELIFIASRRSANDSHIKVKNKFILLIFSKIYFTTHQEIRGIFITFAPQIFIAIYE